MAAVVALIAVSWIAFLFLVAGMLRVASSTPAPSRTPWPPLSPVGGEGFEATDDALGDPGARSPYRLPARAA